MRLPRLHLFELEDQPWMPTRLRDFHTDVLELVNRFSGVYDVCLPVLERLGEQRYLDLCSGGGGPWLRWLAQTSVLPGAQVTLSDKYPNLRAFERAACNPRIRFVASPLDATAVPVDYPGVRTLFTAIHHLAPDALRALAQDAVAKRMALAAFDFNQRNWLQMLGIPVMGWLASWLGTPLLPFDWGRLFWTYCIPVIPASVAWDGWVSQWRSYTCSELSLLVQPLASPDYRWEVGSLPVAGGLGSITYLVGAPLEEARA